MEYGGKFFSLDFCIGLKNCPLDLIAYYNLYLFQTVGRRLSLGDKA